MGVGESGAHKKRVEKKKKKNYIDIIISTFNILCLAGALDIHFVIFCCQSEVPQHCVLIKLFDGF